MKKYCCILIVICTIASCAGKNDQQTVTSATDTVVSKAPSFFPVTSFIRGQIITLDSIPVTPLQITTIHNKVDSAWLTKQQLLPLLQPFLTPVIDETSMLRYFNETRFNDQTLNAITFTYDPIGKLPDSISLRHWDVYVSPEKGRVDKVYLVKNIRENDASITQQLTWQTDQMAKITTILNKPDGKMELLKEVVFTWHF